MAVTKLNLRNALINGDLTYWQRGITFAAVADSTYTADRWMYRKTGTMVHTVSRSTDVPSSAFGVYSLLVDCTTVPVSIGVSDNILISQRIEGNMLRPLKGKKLILVFWVKSTKTGTFCVSIRNGTDTRSLIKEYTVSTTNTWEKKTIRFEHNTAGTWDYTNGIGLKLSFVLACGSNLVSTANTWQNGNFIATANQVNACDNVANDFRLSDVCLVEDNEGQTREPEFVLAGRDIFEELQLCQRYYEKSYNLDVAPGTAVIEGSVCTVNGAGTGGASIMHISTEFKTRKRANPLADIYDTNGTINTVTQLTNGNTATNGASIHGTVLSENGLTVRANCATSNVGFRYHFAASAEL